MRTASARADETSVKLRHVNCRCDLADFLPHELGLNLLHIAFLRQPAWQTGRVPPSIRDGVIAQDLGNPRFLFLALRFQVTEGSNVRHSPSRCFGCTLSAVATGNTLSTTHSTNFRGTEEDIGPHRESVSPAFAFATLRESRRKDLFAFRCIPG